MRPRHTLASLHPYPVWQKTTAEYTIGYIDGLLDGLSHADHEISLDTPWPPSRETIDRWVDEILHCIGAKQTDQLIEIADHAVALGPDIPWTEGHKRDRVFAALVLCGRANGTR